jgi:hypothetical protein
MSPATGPATGPAIGKVFGVGWAKTGTTTLGRCLQLLGFTHQGQDLSLMPDLMRGDPRRALEIASRSQAFEDWPWILLFRELDAGFPGGKFVLTTRDPLRWLASYRRMLRAEGPANADLAAIRAFLFGVDPARATDAELIARVRRHDDEVRAHFRDRPGDLLVVDWERGDGWGELCGFLGVPAPAPPRPFPHLNRGK